MVQFCRTSTYAHACMLCGRINKASEEWLEGIRTPDEGKDELGTPQDADSGGAPSGEQEKTAAVTSA